MSDLIGVIIVFLTSYAGVAAYRRWSERKGIFDLPNERSSHAEPTPRGGGLVIAAVCLSAYSILAYFGNGFVSWSYFAGALVVVVISWLDDLYSVSFVVRLFCHTLAACLLVATAGGFETINVSGTGVSLHLGAWGNVVAILWIVWMINAYNFMDGIDGIAGLQAVVGGIGWWLFANAHSANGIGLYSILVAAASLGFLLHNWQPARIFMGDAGSAFLGFTFAALPLLAAAENHASGANFAFVGIVMVWFFLFDTIVTILTRTIKRQKIWTAHRDHLYQKMIIAGRSHRFVTTFYGVLSTIVIGSLFVTQNYSAGMSVLPIFFIVILSSVLYFTARENTKGVRRSE